MHEPDQSTSAREFVEAVQDELVNQNGQSMVRFLVRWDRRLWLRKPHASWPEMLGYRLAGSWLNIPETIPGSEAPGAMSLSGAVATDAQGPLIRVGQTLTLNELPIRDLDEAIASELAYSVWVRRRDPSYWNRVYVDGVPVFFDHHIAFGTEHDHRSLDGFLSPGPDGGYAGQWRLRTLGQSGVPTTMGERALPRHIAVHRVRKPEDFWRHLDRTVRRIQTISDADLQTAVWQAAAPRIVASWLAEWRDELPEAVRRLKFKPILEAPDG